MTATLPPSATLMHLWPDADRADYYQRIRRTQPGNPAIDALPWDAWLGKIVPTLGTFATHHERFWRHIWTIEPGTRPVPFVAIWARGGAKSSSAELATIALGARGKRRYGLYVSGTQEQADKHLDAIAAMLESSEMATHYPGMANRAVNKYGSSRGWRRNRLTTASGFVVDAVGLRTGTRGVKFEDARPDFIILDDIDELDDGTEATEKKIHTLTHTLLPAGSNDLAVVAIQNLIIPDGIFARLSPDADEPADFLADRDVSGPIPAIWNLTTETQDGRVVITGGDASWAGQPRAVCQQQINDWGYDAFLAEAQHQPRLRGAKVFQPEWWDGKARYDAEDDAWLRRTMEPAGGQRAFRIMDWDTAETINDGSAWSACVVSELYPVTDGYRLRVREVRRGRYTFPQLMDAIYQASDDWNRDGLLYDVAIEIASSGRQAFQTLQAEQRLYAAGVQLTPVTPTQSKELRAAGASQWARLGRVELPKPSPVVDGWLPGFQQELFLFPQSPYMDRVDAFSQQVNRWAAWLAPKQGASDDGTR
jgi:phage terminase large subunit-like protein